FGRAALGAALELRQIAGHPEQLELEREPQRVKLGALGWRAALDAVEEVEEASQRQEGAVVALLLGEEAQRGLGADEPDGEAAGGLPGRRARAERSGARHRAQPRPAPGAHPHARPEPPPR